MTIGRRTFLGLLGAGGVAAATGTAQARDRKVARPEAVGLLYDATKCVGCQACVVGCADANGMPRESRGGLHQDPIDLSAHTKNIIKLYKKGDQQSFMKMQCMHCVDPACVSVCMIGAFQKNEQGIVTYDKDHCVGCRYCQVACPFNVPKFEWQSAVPLITKCELCRHRLAEGKEPGCVESCPKEAVIFGRRDELLKDAKARVKAAPGRYNPQVYGETDGGGTNVFYLAAKDISFDALGLPNLGPEAVPHLSETIQHGVYQGFIAPAGLLVGLGVAVFRSRRAQGEDDDGKGGEG